MTQDPPIVDMAGVKNMLGVKDTHTIVERYIKTGLLPAFVYIDGKLAQKPVTMVAKGRNLLFYRKHVLALYDPEAAALVTTEMPETINMQGALTLLGYQSIQSITGLVDKSYLHAYYHQAGRVIERLPGERFKGTDFFFYKAEVEEVKQKIDKGEIVLQTGARRKEIPHDDRYKQYERDFYETVTLPKRRAAAEKRRAEKASAKEQAST